MKLTISYNPFSLLTNQDRTSMDGDSPSDDFGPSWYQPRPIPISDQPKITRIQPLIINPIKYPQATIYGLSFKPKKKSNEITNLQP